jgi:hypothetical protein
LTKKISKLFNINNFLIIMDIVMFLDSQFVSIIPVFGRYISLEDIQPPQPAANASKILLSELYEMAFPKLCSLTSDKKVVASALPSTYPSVSPNRPRFDLGAPLKGTLSPYSQTVVNFAKRSGRFIIIE